MTKPEDLPKRKQHRLSGYDYSKSGYYFVTTCTENRIPLFSLIIGQMKRFASKKCEKSIWQKSFYDEIIRNQAAYDEISKYIFENPMKWEEDELFCK